jgi:hypothetical protein
MDTLKWFSGGNERSKQAEDIIADLLDDLKIAAGNESLEKVLEKYLEELKQKGASVPLILSRMNLDISKAIRNDGLTLSIDQENKLKELMAIANIRYGY